MWFARVRCCAAIRRHLKSFPQPLLRKWTDITLAARERFGAVFFKRSPAAFFVDNVKHAAQGRRTPPDWWHEIRKAEETSRGQQLRQSLTDPRFKTPVAEVAASKSGLSSVAEVLGRLPLQSS